MKICTIDIDLSHVPLGTLPKPSGGRYYRLDYEIVLLFGLTELKALAAWKENVRFLYIITVLLRWTDFLRESRREVQPRLSMHQMRRKVTRTCSNIRRLEDLVNDLHVINLQVGPQYIYISRRFSLREPISFCQCLNWSSWMTRWRWTPEGCWTAHWIKLSRSFNLWRLDSLQP